VAEATPVAGKGVRGSSEIRERLGINGWDGLASTAAAEREKEKEKNPI
jgi:hypothetical protein